MKEDKVKIKVFPALNGDCFLVSYSSDGDLKNILIDCGYNYTYQRYLKDELKMIGERGESLERFIITHIDADHIMGAIPFLKENKNNFVSIKQIWHNTYRHMQPVAKFPADNAATDSARLIFKQLIDRGYNVDKSAREESEISAQQGTTLGALILQGHYSWNEDFNKQAVSTDHRQSIQLDKDASIFLLSPNNQKLALLGSFWKDELEKFGISGFENDSDLLDDAFEMMVTWEKKPNNAAKEISSATANLDELIRASFIEDTGITNGSSIAFILNTTGKRLLFLGDSHPQVIVDALNTYKSDGVIIFDLIKVSHHGSFRNTSVSLLKKIDAGTYIISTNGKGGHPDRETIAHIVTRNALFIRHLYFNYKTPHSEFFNRTDWMVKYNYLIHYLTPEDNTITL